MSIYDAYSVGADGTLGIGSEIQARLRSLLERTVARSLGQVSGRTPGVIALGERERARVSTALRALERGAPLSKVRDTLQAIRSWLHGRLSNSEATATDSDRELRELLDRVLAHGQRGTIEDYSPYVFTVDVAFDTSGR